MSWRLEKTSQGQDLVLDGWENGIAPSPHKGVGNLQNINISSIPGEAFVNYDRVAQIEQEPIAGGTLAGSSNTQVTYTGTPALIPGTWINISASTISGLSTGYYFILDQGSGSFRRTLSATFNGAGVSGMGSSGSATFSTYNAMTGAPAVDWTSELTTTKVNRYYIMLNGGATLTRYTASNYQSGYTTWSLIDKPGNTRPSDGNPSIVAYKGYLLSFVDGKSYYKALTAAGLGGAWNLWQTSALYQSNVPHISILTRQGNVVYFCNGTSIGSVFENPGSTFDPTSAATFTRNLDALLLYTYEIAKCLAEIGDNLVIGALTNNLYIWDKLSPFFALLPLPEGNVVQAVTVNNMVYLFAGNKGNIYVTNGNTASAVLTISDYVTGETEPYYSWGGVMYLRGRIFFSVNADTDNIGGIWSFVPTQNFFVEQETGLSLRLENKSSYDTYLGKADILLAPVDSSGQQARGAQYWSVWDNGTSNYGIDFSGTTPYVGGEAVIETDIVPTGTFTDKKTFSQVEIKLASPLATGESIAMYYRENMTDAWVSLSTSKTETGTVSQYWTATFQNTQWLQLRAELTSVTDSPSFVRVKEIRVR